MNNYRLALPLCGTPNPSRKVLERAVALARDPFNVDAFFDNRRSNIGNPLADKPECLQLCGRLRRAVEDQERILVYGDYDCDGVTSITLMLDALKALGVTTSLVNWIIPDRLRDGYGIKKSRLEPYFKSAEKDGLPDLIIAVDCGSNSRTVVGDLLARGMDVIVIDHHHLSRSDCLLHHERLIHLNPWLWWKTEKHARFCAAGMTFFVADALNAGNAAWSRERAILLAGLATCADVVPLVGLNRKILKYSLSLARDPEKLKLVPGLHELAKCLSPVSVFNEDVYGYVWGPCLNAPGRMGKADDAVRLLSSENSKEASPFARHCVRANGWRKSTERAVLNAAMRQAAAQVKDNPKRKILFLCHPNWHPGVVGIVAARVRDRYDRPVFVSTYYGSGVWKGSARGIVGSDVGALIQLAIKNRMLKEGGGHEMAGGITFMEENRQAVQPWLDENCGLSSKELETIVHTAAPVSVFNPKDWAISLKQLSPFGKDNETPALFVEAAELRGVREVKTKDPITQSVVLLGYEGLFHEISTGRLFYALWTDYELADLIWEVHRFLDEPDSVPGCRIRLDCLFKLDLELYGFVTAADRKRAREGARLERTYNFIVRQCRRIENGTRSNDRSDRRAST